MKKLLMRAALGALLGGGFVAQAGEAPVVLDQDMLDAIAVAHAADNPPAPAPVVEEAEEEEVKEEAASAPKPNVLDVRPKIVDKVYNFIVHGSIATPEQFGPVSAGFGLKSIPAEIGNLILASFVDKYGWFISPKTINSAGRLKIYNILEALFEPEVGEGAAKDTLLVHGLRRISQEAGFEEGVWRFAQDTGWSQQHIEEPTLDMVNAFGTGCGHEDNKYATFGDNLIAIKDEKTGKAVQLINVNKIWGKKTRNLDFEFSYHKKYFFALCDTADDEEAVLVFDYKSGALIKRLDVDDKGNFVCTHDERYSAYSADGKVKLLTMKDMTEKDVLLFNRGVVSCLAFSWDDACLAVGYEDGTVALVDTETCRQVRQLKYAVHIKSITFSPSNEYMAVIAQSSEEVGAIEPIDNESFNVLYIVAKGNYASLQEILITLALQNAKTVEERRGIVGTETFKSLAPERQKYYADLIERWIEPHVDVASPHVIPDAPPLLEEVVPEGVIPDAPPL